MLHCVIRLVATGIMHSALIFKVQGFSSWTAFEAECTMVLSDIMNHEINHLFPVNLYFTRNPLTSYQKLLLKDNLAYYNKYGLILKPFIQWNSRYFCTVHNQLSYQFTARTNNKYLRAPDSNMQVGTESLQILYSNLAP